MIRFLSQMPKADDSLATDAQEALSRKHGLDTIRVLPLASGRIAVLDNLGYLVAICDDFCECIAAAKTIRPETTPVVRGVNITSLTFTI